MKKNSLTLKINKAISMDSNDVVKADKMIDKIEKNIVNKEEVENLFLDLEDRKKNEYEKEVYVRLWNLILYDANKTQYLIDLYNNQSDEVKGKFIDIFKNIINSIKELEEEDMFDEGESTYPLLLEIEKRFESINTKSYFRV
jgi:hypothetical protein